jgi:predicted heme/steroid binding protein
MIKADRMAAWVLFATIISFGVTGYGMTKGFISPDVSRSLHLGWLGAIGLTAFIVHTSWAIHLFFIRHSIWNRATKIILVSFYLALFAFFIWLNFFYVSSGYSQQTQNSSVVTAASSASSTDTVFTAETLAKYDGQNGQPAYVAIDGVVYDVSKEFKNGDHHGHSAGQDLSQSFHGQHPESYLKGLTVVGTYQN